MTNTNAIANAVEPIKQASIDRAVVSALKVINTIKERLIAADMDARVVAPYPRSSSVSRIQYKQQVELYNLVNKLTMHTKSSLRSTDADTRTFCQVCEDKFIAEVSADAAASYEAYVYKLNTKIGAVQEAKMVYNNGVWYDSTLAVVTEAGESQRWNTKVILNCSKFGKIFNQFPTRQAKK